jgi:hypothetical protein
MRRAKKSRTRAPEHPLRAFAAAVVVAAALAWATLLAGDGMKDVAARALRNAEGGKVAELLAIAPKALESVLAGDPALAAGARTTLARLLARGSSDPDFEKYVAVLDRERIARVSAGSESREELRGLLDFLLLDPVRFFSEEKFRGRVLPVLARAWDPSASAGLRDVLLSELGASGALSYSSFEELQAQWGAVSRRNDTRREEFRPASWSFPSDVSGTIRASIYSLPSAFFSLGDADRFLSAVRQANPRRDILAFSDLPLSRALAPAAERLGVHVLETYGWGFTPWTRDTFSLLRSPSGRILALSRPPGLLQGGRERDREMARELVKDLPEALDRQWRHPVWAGSPVPFHNGQVLLTPAEAWISLHSLEPRILELLGVERVPVSSFSETAGVESYLVAARKAAGELERLYRRKARWVHPLPESGSAAERRAAMERIGGGAGFDLDSYATFLPAGRAGKERALIGDVGLGQRFLGRALPADRQALAEGYGLEGGDPVARIAAYQTEARAARLRRYLDLVAGDLARQGVAVSRLPIFLVPSGLLARREAAPDEPDFLVTWNNVVVQSSRSGIRAEGFSGLFPIGDRAAKDAFAAAGCELELLPPLVESVIANGGYRCASNHLRAFDGGPAEPAARTGGRGR